jgi:hypothetical protein
VSSKSRERNPVSKSTNLNRTLKTQPSLLSVQIIPQPSVFAKEKELQISQNQLKKFSNKSISDAL